MRFLHGFVALALLATIAPSDASKILALFVFPGKSHSNMLNAVLEGLLAKGHEVTVVTNFPLAVNTPNYTHVDISPPYDYWSVAKVLFQVTTIFEMHDIPFNKQIELINVMAHNITEHALRHPNVQKLLHSSADQHFDLVLVEQFFQEAFLMFAHQFRAPIVSIASFEYAQKFDSMMGAFGAWSYLAHDSLLYDQQMTFAQRVVNVYMSLMDAYHLHFGYMPVQQQLADKYFAHLPEPRPTIDQLNRNLSLLLLNGHLPLTAVRPSVPALVDVGGLHIADVRPLPKDLRAFLDGATHGVIYFSLGTQLRSADMPAEQLDVFLRAFRSRPNLRIVWKWEDETVADQLPANVLLKKYMPQNDILAHPNVRMFITHGGLLGTQEGVHHAVPMLGLPVYADQHVNMAKAERAGYALSLSFTNVSDASLAWAFDELLVNPRYAAEVQRVSQIFRDRPERPLDKAVYWIEYVIRHGGAPHLRSAALDMSFWSLYLLDIVAAGVAVVLLAVGLVWFLVRKLLCVARGLGRSGKKTVVSKNKKRK